MTVSIIIVISKQMENCSSSKLSHLSFYRFQTFIKGLHGFFCFCFHTLVN